jgi:pyruvate/2-oxoglutarate dehydrogenase complex dihydrolipoamide dehydrogenase (E3) component
MSDNSTFDFAILGGGSAGYAAARTAASLGLKTVVIDGAAELGGLCILRGCMPSKTLIESANRNLVIRESASFGLSAQAGPVSTLNIRDRKRRLITEFASYRKGQLEDGRFTLIRGFGKFEEVSDDVATLSVELLNGGSQQISARSVLIATGSEVSVPNITGLTETGFWTSDTLLDAAEIPDSFIVLGGGPIALEMAHFLEGIGREVTVVQRSAQLLSTMDADLAAVVQHAFEGRGIKVLCDTKIESFEATTKGKRITLQHQGVTKSLEASEILVALGRKPALKRAGIDRIGLDLAPSGHVCIKTTMQTSHPRIFAAGDVCGPLEVVHLAIQQGEVAAKNAALLLKGENAKHVMDYRCKLFGVFTEPQVASVGLSEAEAKTQGLDYLVATYPFNDHGKSLVMDECHGFVKLIADKTNGLILGGSLVGPEATELIHEIAVGMHLHITANQLATAPHYHPTLSEIWTYPAEEIGDQIQQL